MRPPQTMPSTRNPISSTVRTLVGERPRSEATFMSSSKGPPVVFVWTTREIPPTMAASPRRIARTRTGMLVMSGSTALNRSVVNPLATIRATLGTAGHRPRKPAMANRVAAVIQPACPWETPIARVMAERKTSYGVRPSRAWRYRATPRPISNDPQARPPSRCSRRSGRVRGARSGFAIRPRRVNPMGSDEGTRTRISTVSGFSTALGRVRGGRSSHLTPSG